MATSKLSRNESVRNLDTFCKVFSCTVQYRGEQKVSAFGNDSEKIQRFEAVVDHA